MHGMWLVHPKATQRRPFDKKLRVALHSCKETLRNALYLYQ